MNLQRLIAIVFIVLGVHAAGLPHVMAQGSTLRPATVTSSDLSQEQKDEIKQFVDANKDGLKGEALAIKKSRNSLLEPLKNPQVSVAFRLEYTRQLSGVVRPLLADKSEVVAVNAMRVTGELATASSVDILAEGLKDKRAGVRYSAASGFENTFKAIQRTVPALGGAQVLKMVDTVQAALQTEQDARVMEGLALALQEASRIPTDRVEGMRDAGVKALAKAVIAKTADRKVGPEADAAFRRAVLAIRTAVTNPNINEPQLQDSTLRSAAEMAGDLLALVYERLKSEAPDGVDANMALMVSEAEKAIFFVQPLLSANAAPKEFKLAELVQQGDANGYRQKALEVIGPNGILTTSPFGFKDDRFIK